jgi:membrane fusion protein (multidrug efflux system)
MKQAHLKKILLIAGGVFVGLGALWAAKTSLKPVLRSTCELVIKLTDKEKKSLPRRLAPVEAVKTELGGMTKRIRTVGKLKANNSIIVKSEINGRIANISFQEGSEVNEGDLLIQFEDSDMVAELKQAEAQYVTAKAAYERSEKLSNRKIESDKKFEEARGNMLMAEAKVESARSKLEKTSIKAPFQGAVGIVEVSPGAYVQAGQELVALVDNSPIKVDFKVPEKFYHQVGEGQVIIVEVDGYKGEEFTGTIEAVDSRIDPASHSIRIKGSIENEDARLKEGMFASISVNIGKNENALIVPETAVEREGEIEFVWAIEKGKAERRRVITGTKENGQVEITGGQIGPGDIVVTVGQIRLSDGAPVKIINLPELNIPDVQKEVEKELEEKKKAEEEEKAAEEALKKATESDNKGGIGDKKDNKDETVNAAVTNDPKGETHSADNSQNVDSSSLPQSKEEQTPSSLKSGKEESPLNNESNQENTPPSSPSTVSAS